MREKFDAQLAILNDELTRMGAICEKVILLASQAMLERDQEAVRQITALSTDIEQLERNVESLCIKLLLQQQPVASDLRQISAALKMITDMKRIGVQAEDIAEIERKMIFHENDDFTLISQMAQSTIDMVTGSIRAYIRQDIRQAQQVIQNDDIVDDQFKAVKKLLIRMITQNPENGEDALDLLMIAKYFEKIGDHAVNIAEWVVFSVTGKYKGEYL